MGVNHVENCDPNATTYGGMCKPGLFGPPRYSHLFGGTVCPWFCDSWDTSVNKSEYHESTTAQYGNATAWAEVAVSRLGQWGFNSLGAWSSPLLTGDEFEHGTLRVANVSPPSLVYGYTMDMLMSPYEHRFADNPLVDVFDPSFAQNCTGKAARHALPRRNDTRLLGYWLDNEIPFSPDYLGGGDLIGSSFRVWSLSGQDRVVAWLRDRYDDSLDKFNSAWGTSAPSWDALPKMHPLPTSAARTADNQAFVTHYVDQYLSVAVGAIKAVDPNHMILGSRLLDSDVFEAVLRGAAPHIDVVDVHCYAEQPCTDLMATAHKITQRPILMSEFGFRARDSGLPNTKGAGPLVDTQTERAAKFTSYIEALVKLKFVVGYHMFMYYDEPAGKQLFGADSNFGLVHEDDDPYVVLTKAFSKINIDAPQTHRG